MCVFSLDTELHTAPVLIYFFQYDIIDKKLIWKNNIFVPHRNHIMITNLKPPFECCYKKLQPTFWDEDRKQQNSSDDKLHTLCSDSTVIVGVEYKFPVFHPHRQNILVEKCSTHLLLGYWATLVGKLVVKTRLTSAAFHVKQQYCCFSSITNVTLLYNNY